MSGKLLTSATRRCSPFVDSASRTWIKPKKSLIGCWAPTATTCGQSPPSRVQLMAGRNGHNRHSFGLPWSVQFADICVREKSSCTCRGPRISVAYFPDSNVRQWNPRVLHARARSREWSSRLLRQATSKKYAYAANLRVDKLADFNNKVFFERSTNSSERVNLNSAL